MKPNGLLATSFDNNAAAKSKGYLNSKIDEKRYSGHGAVVTTVLRSSLANSQLIDEFKDSYLNERRDTGPDLDSTVSPGQSPNPTRQQISNNSPFKSVTPGGFDKLENTMYASSGERHPAEEYG
jgi:hypothetical protein